MRHPLLVSAIFLGAISSAHAQSGTLPLWEVAVFGGALVTPAYPGSVDRTSRGAVLPYLIYRGEVFRADRSGIGARVAHTDDYELDVGLSASLPASSDDVAARKDMPDLGTLLEFGPRLKVTLARPAPDSQIRLDVPLRMVLELNGGVRDQGVVFEPKLSYEKQNIGYGWSLSTSAGLLFGDQRLNQFFYGVSGPYATATRPRYDAQAGLIATRLGLSGSKALTPDLRIAAFVRNENYAGAANLASPLHLAPQGTSLGMGLNWTLGRSKQLAKD